jgi:UDP-glucose:(heptosyl)LPS alpha-1,3-glucosyltransferase
MDSFAMAPLEAMAHGLPVILSAQQYCGFAAFVHDRHDAWILEDPRNSQAIAEALLALDPREHLRERLVFQSAQLVEQFSWQRVAERYESLYQDVLSERNHIQSQPRSR